MISCLGGNKCSSMTYIQLLENKTDLLKRQKYPHTLENRNSKYNYSSYINFYK